MMMNNERERDWGKKINRNVEKEQNKYANGIGNKRINVYKTKKLSEWMRLRDGDCERMGEKECMFICKRKIRWKIQSIN